jgi:hypothetical protein
MSVPYRKEILLSTTDTLPAAPGVEHAVKRTKLVWVSGYSTIGAVMTALIDAVRANNWDAVVGVRFIETPYHSSATGGVTPETQFKWTVYGTAIAW